MVEKIEAAEHDLAFGGPAPLVNRCYVHHLGTGIVRLSFVEGYMQGDKTLTAAFRAAVSMAPDDALQFAHAILAVVGKSQGNA